jgi:hypothetical protein
VRVSSLKVVLIGESEERVRERQVWGRNGSYSSGVSQTVCQDCETWSESEGDDATNSKQLALAKDNSLEMLLSPSTQEEYRKICKGFCTYIE